MGASMGQRSGRDVSHWQVRRWSHRLNSVARLAEPAAGLALAAGAGPAGQAGGEPIGKSIPPGDRAASNRAVELIGKHLGMFIDKNSIDISYIDDADEYLAKIMAIVDAKTVEHEPAPLPIDYEMAEQDDGAH